MQDLDQEKAEGRGNKRGRDGRDGMSAPEVEVPPNRKQPSWMILIAVSEARGF